MRALIIGMTILIAVVRVGGTHSRRRVPGSILLAADYAQASSVPPFLRAQLQGTDNSIGTKKMSRRGMSPDSEEAFQARVAYNAMVTLRRVHERRRERMLPVDPNFFTFLHDAHDYDDQLVYTRVTRNHFVAWRAVARWLRSARCSEIFTSATFDESQSYQQARFLAELMRSEYACCLDDLWAQVSRLATGSDTGVRLWETFTVAHQRMPFSAIKTCSYSAAVVHVDASRPIHWRWYDPGNWCYATIWYIIKKAARHWRDSNSHYQEGRAFGAARDIHLSMRGCEVRWPRQWPAFYELAGDLFEMLLARGYCDRELEHIIDELSIIIGQVLGIYRNMRNNFRLPRVPHVEPYVFADALLAARAGHRTLEWVPFNRLIWQHAPLQAQPGAQPQR